MVAPPGRGTRPTSDRVREAAYSALDSLGVVEGAKVWDLFAGSGAMGIEALSRGASHVTFVEQGRGAVSAARDNLARLGYGPDRATVVCGDVVNWVTSQVEAAGGRRPVGGPSQGRSTGGGPAGGATKAELRVDLVTADPPYAWQGWTSLLGSLAPLGPLVLAETGEELVLPDGWQALRSKRYGGTVVTLARPRETENDQDRSK